ncbi:interferon-stimulated 20 kDa exonuclease-like 2 [Clytia hemisphaerica]|uniref:RNA exonuclease 4 n=1 Tax=Clytia hemisphaerica TaxID=252671 RepID=A0A7M5WWK9_9CNID
MLKSGRHILNSDGESESSSNEMQCEKTSTLLPCPENLVALDCEMVGVGKSKHDSLARCSIVDYHGNVLYDQYVQSRDQVTDYRTPWSGIRPKDLENAVPFLMARRQILQTLKGKIIVGHALNFDMKILKIHWPKDKIRDTSKFQPLRAKANLKDNNTPSLRRLTRELLFRDIQRSTHCSIEDSIAAMDLYRIVENEWEKPTKSVYFDDLFWPKCLDNK